jgi:hypothetical protein
MIFRIMRQAAVVGGSGFFGRARGQFGLFCFVAEQPSSNRAGFFTWDCDGSRRWTMRSNTFVRDMIEPEDQPGREKAVARRGGA